MEKLFCETFKELSKLRSRKLKYKDYYQKKKNDILLQKKDYYTANNFIIKEKSKEYSLNNPEYRKEYYENNKDKFIDSRNRNKEKNEDKLKKYRKEYYENNKEQLKLSVDHEKRRVYQNNYVKVRKINDSLYKLKRNVRTTITNSFKNNGFSKTTRTHIILGCTFEEFKIHLEKMFEDWMTWENKGLYNGELCYGWDIDHKIPVSSATTEEEIIKLNHYTNLQPLCSFVNRNIKRDNLCTH
jgi:hypothetical protein